MSRTHIVHSHSCTTPEMDAEGTGSGKHLMQSLRPHLGYVLSILQRLGLSSGCSSQLPYPGKAADDSPSTWITVLQMETWIDFWAPGFDLTKPQCSWIFGK